MIFLTNLAFSNHVQILKMYTLFSSAHTLSNSYYQLSKIYKYSHKFKIISIAFMYSTRFFYTIVLPLCTKQRDQNNEIKSFLQNLTINSMLHSMMISAITEFLQFSFCYAKI